MCVLNAPVACPHKRAAGGILYYVLRAFEESRIKESERPMGYGKVCNRQTILLGQRTVSVGYNNARHKNLKVGGVATLTRSRGMQVSYATA
jgi:hypothetical protein